MTIASPNHRSIRLASIESLQPFQDQFQQIAEQFGLGLNADEQQSESAPFCGYEIFSQNIMLVETDGQRESASRTLDRCIEAIESLAESGIADGFVEVLD